MLRSASSRSPACDSAACQSCRPRTTPLSAVAGTERARNALLALTARTIVHANADLSRIPPRVHPRVRVIPHGEYGGLARRGGDPDRDGARAEVGLDPDAPATLLFGQLRPDKGLGDVLAALVRVPALHLLIAGQEEGALAAARAQLAHDELAGRVTIREGYLEMTEAAVLFAATDTVVSVWRGQPERRAAACVWLPSSGYRLPRRRPGRGRDRRRDGLDLRARRRRCAREWAAGRKTSTPVGPSAAGAEKPGIGSPKRGMRGPIVAQQTDRVYREVLGAGRARRRRTRTASARG